MSRQPGEKLGDWVAGLEAHAISKIPGLEPHEETLTEMIKFVEDVFNVAAATQVVAASGFSGTKVLLGNAVKTSKLGPMKAALETRWTAAGTNLILRWAGRMRDFDEFRPPCRCLLPPPSRRWPTSPRSSSSSRLRFCSRSPVWIVYPLACHRRLSHAPLTRAHLTQQVFGWGFANADELNVLGTAPNVRRRQSRATDEERVTTPMSPGRRLGGRTRRHFHRPVHHHHDGMCAQPTRSRTLSTSPGRTDGLW
jgi:hypothetical protein